MLQNCQGFKFDFKYFIDNYQENLDKVNQTKDKMDVLESDPTIAYYLAQLDAPEIKQLITMYTNPKMLEAINNTNRIVQYLNKVKSIQLQQNNSKVNDDVVE